MNGTQTLTPLDYAKAACDTMIRRFRAQDLPPKGHFHYHQGVFLSGMYQTYLLSGDEKYFDYMKEWVDSVIDEKGEVKEYDPGQLDDIQPAILLFPLYERTGDERYRRALDTLLPLLLNFPVNEAGGFWHKEMYPNQMWLDGLYMAGPASAEYAKRFGQPQYLDLAVSQALLMQENTRDTLTGLWYHAWDSSKKAEWAAPDTGLSAEFWGRSIGWVPVAILDELDFMEPEHPGYQELCGLVKSLLTAVCHYQSEDGRWYQVVDKAQEEGNWPENSCTCLFAAALSKAVRRGVMDRAYLEQAKKGYQGVIRSLEWDGDDLLLGGVCVGTGVGDYAHYCARPVSVNDLHGMGAFLLMCAEIQRSLKD